MRMGGLLATVALTTSVLTSCAEPGADAASDPLGPVRLTDRQAVAAMLTEKDLGRSFERFEPAQGDGGGGFKGCLAAFDELDEKGGPEPLVERESAYRVGSRFATPQVFLGVASFAKQARAERLVDAFARAFAGCRQAAWTEPDGMRWKLAVSSDRLATTSRAEEHFNLRIDGTISGPGGSIPISVHVTVARIANNAVYLLAFDTKEHLRSLPTEVAGAAVARLHAVMAGQELPPRRPLLKDYPITTLQDLAQRGGG